MQLALAEAEKGAGFVSPNPLVGAVAAKSGKLLGAAFHSAYGNAHAEVALLSRLTTEQAAGATIYVNLEPCCHWGKTAPCTEALASARIARVVVGCEDVNPLVSGRGIAALRQAGIRVDLGVCADAARELNAPFFTYITKRRPWILLKVAQSIDGRIALQSGESRWISGVAARAAVHRLRARLDAVLVGSQTVIDDDPELTVRHVPGRNPLRVVLDSRLRVAPTARVFQQPRPDQTWLITTPNQPADRLKEFEARGATLFTVRAMPDGRLDLAATFQLLAEHGVTSVLVEGGGTVHASMLAENLFDRFVVCIAPKVIGGDGRPAVGELRLSELDRAPQLQLKTQQMIGDDLWLEYTHHVHGNY